MKQAQERNGAAQPPAHIRPIGIDVDERDRGLIAGKLARQFGKFASSIERISVRLSDANGPKGGNDLTARIKVVLRAVPSVVIEERDSMLHRAIDRAVKAAARAVRRSLHRRRLKPLHHRASRPSGLVSVLSQQQRSKPRPAASEASRA